MMVVTIGRLGLSEFGFGLDRRLALQESAVVVEITVVVALQTNEIAATVQREKRCLTLDALLVFEK